MIARNCALALVDARTAVWRSGATASEQEPFDRKSRPDCVNGDISGHR